jgi:hypothetical protein
MQAWHKEQKVKAIKKSKASQQKERNEKLGRRNPDRLQRQIDELKTVIESGRDNAHNRRQLADLEKDLAAVRRARKALGIEDEARAGQKRRREGEGESVGAGEKVEESDSGEFLFFEEEWERYTVKLTSGCRREYEQLCRRYPPATRTVTTTAGGGGTRGEDDV